MLRTSFRLRVRLHECLRHDVDAQHHELDGYAHYWARHYGSQRVE